VHRLVPGVHCGAARSGHAGAIRSIRPDSFDPQLTRYGQPRHDSLQGHDAVKHYDE